MPCGHAIRHVLLALLFSLLASVALAEATVAFATGDYPPYTSSALDGQGSTTQLVSAICAAAGIAPSFGFYPWKRAELVVEQGEAFAAFPYSKTAEREGRFAFSAPLYRVNNAIVFNTLNPRTPKAPAYARDEDLKPYRVGIIRGSFAEPRLKAAGVAFEAVSTIEQGIAMLLASRIDLYIEDKASIAFVLAEKFAPQVGQVQSLARPFDEGKANYLMVSRRYPGAAELLDKFNRGLLKLQKSGEYERLTTRFNFAPSAAQADR